MDTARHFLELLVATTLLLSDHTTHALKAADFFKICRRSDPKLNDCVKETLNTLRPDLKKGIAALKIPSVEPMKIPRLQVLQGSGPVSIDSTFIDLSIQGITNFEIKSVSVDLDNYRIDLQVALPWMYASGDYKISGQVLVLPIRGEGDSWSNYTDVTGTASLIGQSVEKDGKEFMELKDFKFSINVKKAIIQMNNLFNGNKQLGDAMNRFMAENWEVVFAELKPVVDEAISVLLKDVAQKVFSKFPFDELFPK